MSNAGDFGNSELGQSLGYAAILLATVLGIAAVVAAAGGCSIKFAPPANPPSIEKEAKP